MNTTDLRIGNYVLYEGHVIRVKNISTQSINLEFDKEDYRVIKWIPAKDLEALSLSTEVLENMGFKYSYSSMMYNISNLTIYLKRKVNTYYLSIEREHKDVAIITSVHQLQNVMFSLFGVELYLRRMF